MRNTVINILLVVLLLAENQLLYYYPHQHILSHTLNACLYFLVSILFGVVLLYKFYNKRIEEAKVSNTTSSQNIIQYLPFILIATVIARLTPPIFTSTPINPLFSDIIPAIQIAVKRFLNGNYPYSPMTTLGYTTPFGYMPMQWLPYSIAELQHFDYRWVTVSIWGLAACIISYHSSKTNKYNGLIVILLALSGYYYITSYNATILGVSVELMIAGYYMLFIAGLNSKSYIIQGIVLSLCILSRFTLLLWLPLWAFTMLVSGNSKLFLKISSVIIVLILLLYIVPFLSKDWSMPFTVISSYSSSSWEWQHICESGLPCHLYDGVGFAHLFYEKYGADNYMEGFNAFRKIFFTITGSTVLLIGTWYWFKRTKIDSRIFLMASFKIYLAVFLAFIIVPYQYLMITGNFVSLAIYAMQLRYKTTTQ